MPSCAGNSQFSALAIVSLLAHEEYLSSSKNEMDEESRRTTESESIASKFEKWNAEKKQLKLEIEAFVFQLKQMETQMKEAASDHRREIEEKDRAIEMEKKKREEMEKRLRAAEQAGEKEARDHADELWRHKKAFAELVSSHRQLEAEMGRALQQVEAARTELEEMFRQREEAMAMAVQLSAEIVEMRKDSEIKETVTEKQLELENQDQAGIQHHRIFLIDHLRDGDLHTPETGGGDSTSTAAQERGEVDHLGLAPSQKDKRVNISRQKHYADVEALSEQIRRKDEKLEAYRWRLLTMELQTERLQSHVEGLEGKLSSLRKERAKLEDQLMDREQELRSLRKQTDLQWQYYRQIESNRSPAPSSPCPRPLWLELRKEQEEDQSKIETQKRSERAEDAAQTGNSTPVLFLNHFAESDREKGNFTGCSEINDKNSSKKVDLHALALSYKINRLKQQLLSFEKLSGRDTDSTQDEKGLRQVLPLLFKQARKYRSLEEKADDLCRRMEKEAAGRCRGSSLKRLLEEAIQIQRHVVGAGQRSAELSTLIAGVDVSGDGERFLHYSPGQFADVIRALLRDIQRGLEVRVARIIGNLEGTLAREGILRSRPREDGSR